MNIKYYIISVKMVIFASNRNENTYFVTKSLHSHKILEPHSWHFYAFDPKEFFYIKPRTDMNLRRSIF